MDFNFATQVKPFDPNWLLSTTAQATAALVAIVGGFLISRLVSMVSEKSAQEHRFAELEYQKKVTMDALTEVSETILARTHQWFMDQHLSSFVQAKGKVDIADIVKNFQIRGSDKSSTLQFALLLVGTVERAHREIEEKRNLSEISPINSSVPRDAGIVKEDSTEETVYERVTEEIAKQQNHVAPTSSLDISEDQETIKPSAPIVYERHDAEMAKQADLRANMKFIAGEMSLIKYRISSLIQPRRLTQGFLVLAYFGVVGILYPLYLMTKNPPSPLLIMRTSVFMAFLSGFVILLLYIVSAVMELRESPIMSVSSSENQTE